MRAAVPAVALARGHEPSGADGPTSAGPRLTGMTGSGLVAAFGIVVIAVNRDLAAGLTIGTLLALALSPVWLPTAAHSRGFRWVAGLAVLALAAGVVLTGLAAADHGTSMRVLLERAFLLIGLVTATGWVLWSRQHLPLWVIGALFGVGLLVGIRPDTGMFADNPWRFGFSVPLTVLGLALAARTGRRWTGAGLALALGAVSALNGGRSTFAMLALTALVVVWQGRRAGRSRPRSVVQVLLLFAGLAYVAYTAGQALILEGYLGEDAQLRTQAQIESSGSLILGGRPEAAASVALIRENPLGYGAGTVPASRDVLVAKSAMAAINYDPHNGYVDNFMFGGRFELHSMLGDLWVWYGPAGAALALTILVVVVHAAAKQIALRRASALVVFLVAKTAWNVAFSPVASAVPLTALALGLLLVVGPAAVKAAARPAAAPAPAAVPRP